MAKSQATGWAVSTPDHVCAESGFRARLLESCSLCVHQLTGENLMRLLSYGLATALIGSFLPASADLISPGVRIAAERLRDNPNTYDRVDNFCNGKKVSAPCSIPGTTFSGGGDGICRSAVNQDESTIDMSCVRNGEAQIDRQLPQGGFVREDLCLNGVFENAERGRNMRWSCKPTLPTPSDQFCTGKSIGARCTVKLHYQDKNEQHEGTCKKITETESYYQRGHRTAKRDVIRCEPPSAVVRSFAPASWRQKLVP